MDLQEQLNNWRKIRTKQLCHRQLVIVSGPEEWACAQAEKLILDCTSNSTLWIGKSGLNQTKIEAKSYRNYLGQEFSALIYNAYSGFRANAILALSGTLKAQGLMIVICPTLESWENFSDPESQQRISFGYEFDVPKSNFIKLLVERIREDAGISLLTPEKLSGTPPLLPKKYASYQINCQSDEQSLAIQTIIRTALGHPHRPLVLSADRGRGKSSALGIAAANLMLEHGKKIILTAPTFKTVEQVFKHASALLSGATVHKQSLSSEHGCLEFMPPDILLSESASADLIMVDEAAAIPTPLLDKITAKFSRVIFSTTLHGYEGSGRGFELRFKKHLNAVCPGWKSLHLTQPIRWHPEDVLERFWFRCMLMDKDTAIEKAALSSDSTDIIEVNSDQLVIDSNLLTNIFQLLVNAHYQTSPDDLVRLLDAPEQRLFILKQQENLLGVALIVEEGGEKLNSLTPLIAAGSRRVKGHLVPQYLTFHYGDLGLCSSNQWRIVRIVIQPDLQVQGLGTVLLDGIQKLAHQENIEFLSSAFGATTQLLGFWQKSLFKAVKLGFKRDASSGEHSAIVLKPLTKEANRLATKLSCRFSEDLHYQIPRQFENIETHLLVGLIKYHCKDSQLSKNDTIMIVQFIENKRPLYSCEHVLSKLLEHCLLRYQHNLYEDYVFLVALLLQFKNDQSLCTEFCLTGKQQIQQRAQQAINNLYYEIFLGNSPKINHV